MNNPRYSEEQLDANKRRIGTITQWQVACLCSGPSNRVLIQFSLARSLSSDFSVTDRKLPVCPQKSSDESSMFSGVAVN